MAQQNKIFMYGRHALREALLHAPQAVMRVFLAPTMDEESLRRLVAKSGVPVLPLTSRSPGADESVSHQGVVAQISAAAIVKKYDQFVREMTVTPDTSLVLLGEVQDPHNVGAIIRTGAAFGASGVLIPEHNQAQLTGAVIKVSAGMAFKIPIVSIGNVNHVVRDLKDKGFWVYGLAGEGSTSLYEERFDAPALFVMGNEASGIRQKTREICDKLLSIPISPRCESLNVAASSAVVLSVWSAQHPPDALKG